MRTRLPGWPQRVFDAIAEAASKHLPDRASLHSSAPTETDPYRHLALTPREDGAAELHPFVGDDAQGIDNFETASRAATFELWEPASERLGRIRQIVDAVTAGRCVEKISYVGTEPVRIEVRLGLQTDEPTTYERALGRRTRPGAPEHRETATFAPTERSGLGQRVV